MLNVSTEAETSRRLSAGCLRGRTTNRSAAGLLIALLLPAWLGCATTPIRKEGEADLRFLPTGPRWRHASMNALRHPITWGAAAGAAVVAAGGWDKKISRWAVERTPVFGSVARARSASDDLRALCNFGMLGTALAVPGGDYPWRSRFERLLVEEGGVWTASSFTGLTQRNIDRERPDGSNHHGFPSGHGTRTFAYNGMTSRNLDANRDAGRGANLPGSSLYQPGCRHGLGPRGRPETLPLRCPGGGGCRKLHFYLLPRRLPRQKGEGRREGTDGE